MGYCLSIDQAASEVQEQGVVDNRDTFLHGVRDHAIFPSFHAFIQYLMQALDEMEKVNLQLSVFVEEVTEAYHQKAEIVKHHPREVGRERQVFVDFFYNPNCLQNQVRELTSRVKALQE